jgi:hypothetical protein
MCFPEDISMRLTRANVAKLSLPAGKSELLVFDDALAGFGLRIRAGGKRTWVAQYRIGLKQRRMSLGSTENLDAEEARKRAKSALSKVNLGTDPQTEKANAWALVTHILAAKGLDGGESRLGELGCGPAHSCAEDAAQARENRDQGKEKGAIVWAIP